MPHRDRFKSPANPGLLQRLDFRCLGPGSALHGPAFGQDQPPATPRGDKQDLSLFPRPAVGGPDAPRQRGHLLDRLPGLQSHLYLTFFPGHRTVASRSGFADIRNLTQILASHSPEFYLRYPPLGPDARTRQINPRLPPKFPPWAFRA
jgi:hypothetical protein